MALGGEARKILVEFLGDSRELVAASRKGEAAVSTFGTKAATAGKIAGKALAGGLLLAGAGMYEATKAAGEDEAAQSQLEGQLKNSTHATHEQIDAVNEWIEKQALAKGIAVDELRPAMAKLSTVTGSVAKAQRLLSAATDISAGSGKDLTSVVGALVKAQNGSVGGLSRLGLATKDASGHTKTFNQILQDSAVKYHGAAAKAADTTAGKERVLGVEMHELSVKIGTGLLPVMGKLVEIGLKVVDFIDRHTKAVGIAIGVLLSLAAIIKTVTVVTAAWNAVMDANPITLVVIALAALAAGLIYAYHHSARFKAIVDATFGFIKKYVPPIIEAVVGFVKDHWGLLVSIIGGPLGIIVVQVIKHWDKVKAVTLILASYVIDKAKDFGKFASLVIDHVGDVVKFFKDLPGKITGFVSGIPGQLKAIGGQMIDGLVSGLTAAGHKVLDYVQSLINKIPKKIREIMGIASPSKVTYELGEYIGQGLADGIASKTAATETAAQKMVDKVKAKLKTVKDAMASLSDSVAASFTGDLFGASVTAAVADADGNVTSPAQSAAQNFIASLTSTSGTLAALKAAFRTLRGWGWKPQMLAQLFQSGNAGLILDLAADRSQASQAAGLLSGIATSSSQLGGLVGQSVYGGQIAHLQDQLPGKGDTGTNNRTYNINVSVPVNGDPVATGREIVKTVRSLERATGRRLLVSPA